MQAVTKVIFLLFTILLATRVRCQYPEAFLECYIEQGLLKFDLGVFRNSIPFSRIYFIEQDRTELTNGQCPTISGDPDPALSETFFRATFFVDPATNLITDGRSCGIEVIESGKEYQFRVETEIEFERDRLGDIIFIYNCHADFAATDVVSTKFEIRDPDLVNLYPPVEVLRLRAVATSGGNLQTTTLGDGSVIPTVDIGDLFALQLEFETTANSSATGATCSKLYVSVDDTYTTLTEDLIDPTTSCPASSASGFLRPATGLKLVSTPTAHSYWYRTGAIEAAKYTKIDIPQATDILSFACEATFCRIEQDPGARRDSECHFGCGDTQTQSIYDEAELQEQSLVDDIDEEESDDPPDWEKMKPCPTVAGGRKRRAVEVLKRSDFKTLVKRNSDRVVTVKIRIQTESAAKSEGISMVIVWSLVGVACVTLVILGCCLVVFCRVRRASYGRSNAYKHQVDANSLSSSNEKSKSMERSSESVSVVKVQY